MEEALPDLANWHDFNSIDRAAIFFSDNHILSYVNETA